MILILAVCHRDAAHWAREHWLKQDEWRYVPTDGIPADLERLRNYRGLPYVVTERAPRGRVWNEANYRVEAQGCHRVTPDEADLYRLERQGTQVITGAGYPYRPGTWALEWCWPCHQAHPGEPVHDEVACPRRGDDPEESD